MTAATEDRTAAAIEQEIEDRRKRRQALASQLEGLGREVEASRNDLGRAVASGSSTKKLRENVRELEDEADGIERALPILDGEIESLEKELERVSGEEAAQAYNTAKAALVDALEAVESELRKFETETLDPLLRHLKKRYDAARQAEKLAARSPRSGITLNPGVSQIHRAAWGDRPGLEGLLKALRAHTDNDLTAVEAYNGKRQGVRDYAPPDN